LRLPPALPALLALLSAPALGAAAPLVLEGEVPEAGRFFDVPFEVPPGTAELEVRHDDLSEANVLDWGLEEPSGASRGYGGGNAEPAVVGERAASRSYLAGPLPPGTWRVTVGKARIDARPARYRIEVHLRGEATLPPQPERGPYAPPQLAAGARWYAGDLHVHSRESGDAQAGLDRVAEVARARGLDFVHLAEHNTHSGLQLLGAVQARHPALLLVPGQEYTTYAGHANAVGATRPVSPRVGEGGWTFARAARAFAEQGAVLSINHPTFDLGGQCIGCAWEHPVALGEVGAVEVGSGGLERVTGRLFTESALAFWDALSAQGHHLAAVGGSDDHRAGEDLSALQSPIGEPTTRVFAQGLSTAALLEGLRASRTVVQLAGPDDPMVELSAAPERQGDTVVAERARLSARVTAARGARVRWVHNGVGGPFTDVTGEAAVVERDVEAPEAGEDRYRLEVWVDGRVRTVTSHVWLTREARFRGVPGPAPAAPPEGRGCAAAGGSAAGAVGLALLAWAGRRRAQRHP
jgi:hypothetical protein